MFLTRNCASFLKENKLSLDTDKTMNTGVFTDMFTSLFYSHSSIKIV